MKIIRDALIIAWINGWIAATRGWIWVVAISVSPVSFLIILAIYGGLDGLKWGLVGGFIWTIASNGISLIGDATYYRLGIKYQSMLTAAPVSPAGYALGLALSSFIFALPTLGVYLAILLWVGVKFLTPLTLYALSALWLASAGIGFTLSSFIKHMRYAWALPQILSAVFTVGAPVYYPATAFPTPYLGVLLPTGASAVLIQHSTGLHPYPQTLLISAAAALALQSVAGLYFLFKLARWRHP
ncbi:ABC transporter permease [Pyrobaculum aerophilum]|uniref:ABC transporter permease n=1 Tax=Pyrobaculum aerophilum TaxID=13773 RepID=UPI002FDAC1BB